MSWGLEPCFSASESGFMTLYLYLPSNYQLVVSGGGNIQDNSILLVGWCTCVGTGTKDSTPLRPFPPLNVGTSTTSRQAATDWMHQPAPTSAVDHLSSLITLSLRRSHTIPPSCCPFPIMHWRDPVLRRWAWSQVTFPGSCPVASSEVKAALGCRAISKVCLGRFGGKIHLALAGRWLGSYTWNITVGVALIKSSKIIYWFFFNSGIPRYICQ
jgi:hypothetical protein